jgi:hypothetical protein
MGINIRNRISKCSITAILKDLPILNQSQLNTFYQKNVELTKPKL